MRKYMVWAWVLVFSLPLSVRAAEWNDAGGGNSDVRSVLIDAYNPEIIFMGTGSAVMKSYDGGKNWRSVLVVKGKKQGVNFLFAADKKSLYAATGNGLFFSPDWGRNWRRLFKGRNYLESQCTAVAVLSDRIYLGTAAGLFTSSDQGRSWQKQPGEIRNNAIMAITYCTKKPSAVYAAASNGVFKLIEAGKWEKVFVAYPSESENSDGADEDDSRQIQPSPLRYIACDPDNPDYLYLATDRGVYKSRDGGATWIALPDYGLLEKEVRFLTVTGSGGLYAAGRRSIFKYEKERWQEVSFGLVVEDIRFFSVDHRGQIFAACDNGLFKSGASSRSYMMSDRMEMYSQDEPSIEELQQAAIRYAEVDNHKIKQWRRQAAMKAYLPTLSASVSRDTADLWHWESGSTTKTGDDVLIKGKDNLDWGVSLSWDLGELIWNDDQTNIDVRSRLMVELRDEILDEVNKTYFERLRVKAELDALAIEERKKRFEKELRIKELTASLDALTGGYFSAHKT